jgi:multidrug efflux pump subunit AcrA (membrane-fusion protein)
LKRDLVRRHLLIVIGLAVLAASCEKTSGEAAGPAGGRGTGRGGRGGRGAAVATQVAPVQRMTVQREVDLSGTLTSPEQARISSEVAGIVRDVRVQLGTEVRAGDVIARLEPRELQLALDRAESALRQVEAQLGIDHLKEKQPPADDQIASVRQATANRDDARAGGAQQLAGAACSHRPRDGAESAADCRTNYRATLDTVHSLKASLQDRRASYELAQKKVADAVIRAPVAGSISERLIQPGEFIRENIPVATIVQMNPLKLKTAIQEKHASLITPGQTVEFDVEAFIGRKFKGRIAYVSPAVDQATRTFAVEALVDNADRQLKPGFFAGRVLTRRPERDRRGRGFDFRPWPACRRSVIEGQGARGR